MDCYRPQAIHESLLDAVSNGADQRLLQDSLIFASVSLIRF